MYIRINKQTNRNDIKLYQVLSQSVAAGSYEVSFYMKSDGASLVTLNVFKSGAAATANGGKRNLYRRLPTPEQLLHLRRPPAGAGTGPW